MTRPERAERLWLVLTVATLWALTVGGQFEAAAFSPLAIRKRPLSCFSLGLNAILAAALRQLPLPMEYFLPDYSRYAPLLC